MRYSKVLLFFFPLLCRPFNNYNQHWCGCVGTASYITFWTKKGHCAHGALLISLTTWSTSNKNLEFTNSHTYCQYTGSNDYFAGHYPLIRSAIHSHTSGAASGAIWCSVFCSRTLWPVDNLSVADIDKWVKLNPSKVPHKQQVYTGQ